MRKLGVYGGRRAAADVGGRGRGAKDVEVAGRRGAEDGVKSAHSLGATELEIAKRCAWAGGGKQTEVRTRPRPPKILMSSPRPQPGQPSVVAPLRRGARTSKYLGTTRG